MKKISLLLLFVLVTSIVKTQDSIGNLSDINMKVEKTLSQRISIYGFVRNYFNIDSRKTYTSVGGEYNMIPYDNKWNLDHTEDLNSVPQAHLQALSTRIGLNIDGPCLMGMNSNGKIEVDFGGFGSYNTLLRLRHAYVKIFRFSENRQVEYLMGQTWHPLSGEIMPDVLGMAAGAPFRPHSRTPQLRAICYWGNFGITASLLYQLQYVNNGPSSATNPTSVASVDFSKNAIIPESFVGLNYKNDSWYIQLSIDAQAIKPRTHGVDFYNPAIIRKVDEWVGAITPSIYAQYIKQNWSIKFRTMLAQNTSHLNQLVGYAVTDVNYLSGSWIYTPLKSTISYLNISYGKKIKYNLFGGYMKNLGCNHLLHDFDQDLGTNATGNPNYYIYLKGGDAFRNLHSVWRVAPSISYNIDSFNIGLEYELTAALFGEIGPYGAIIDNENLHTVFNHRLCFLVKYNFR